MSLGTSIFLRQFPFDDRIVIMEGKDKGKCTDELSKWTESIQRQTGSSPVAPVPAVQLTGIDASESGDFGGTLSAGLYTIKVYREVTVEDPVSSSLAVTLTWTHNGKAMSRTLSAFAGAPQADTDSASDVTMIEIDPNTTIGYTLNYSSNTLGLAEFQATLLAQLDQTVG